MTDEREELYQAIDYWHDWNVPPRKYPDGSPVVNEGASDGACRQMARLARAELQRIRDEVDSMARDCRRIADDPSYRAPLNIPFLALAQRLEELMGSPGSE
jgi:hypothetical protein